MNNKKGLGVYGIVILVIGIILFMVLVFGVSNADAFGKIKNFLPSFNSDEDLDAINSGDSLSGGDTSTADSLEFKKRTEEEVLFSLQYGKSELGRCDCGDDCGDYAKWIIENADKSSVDALLVASLMMQESSCQSGLTSSDGSSRGLMQINAKLHCKDYERYGLPSNLEECKNLLLNNPEKNLEVGVRILKSYYSSNYKIYECDNFKSANQNEKAISETYTGWGYALRRYNGWSCAGYREDKTEIYADQNFVEDVVSRYNELNKALNKKF